VKEAVQKRTNPGAPVSKKGKILEEVVWVGIVMKVWMCGDVDADDFNEAVAATVDAPTPPLPKSEPKPHCSTASPHRSEAQFSFEKFPAPGKRPASVTSPRPTPYMDHPNLRTLLIREVKFRRYMQDKYEDLLDEFYATHRRTRMEAHHLSIIDFYNLFIT